MKPVAIAAMTVLLLPVGAHAEVTVKAAWARASILASRPGAAYLTLTSDRTDRLVQITTPVASQAMIHAIEMDKAGVSRMHHLKALDLTPGMPVTLAPGGMHVMLTGLAGKLEEGTSFPLVLVFEAAGAVTVDVQVLGPGASGPEDKNP